MVRVRTCRERNTVLQPIHIRSFFVFSHTSHTTRFRPHTSRGASFEGPQKAERRNSTPRPLLWPRRREVPMERPPPHTRGGWVHETEKGGGGGTGGWGRKQKSTLTKLKHRTPRGAG